VLKNDLKELVGLQVLEQTETPGLGTKVTEEPFTNQFVELVAEPNVGWVKGAPPTNTNEIQTITGATISSKAIVNIVNAGLKKLREVKNSGVEL
jgi:Na+-translocating ferredoxin:NAD+ oxidoreductase RnfG subunit